MTGGGEYFQSKRGGAKQRWSKKKESRKRNMSPSLVPYNPFT